MKDVLRNTLSRRALMRYGFRAGAVACGLGSATGVGIAAEDYTRGHNRRVAEHGQEMGKKYGDLPPQSIIEDAEEQIRYFREHTEFMAREGRANDVFVHNPEFLKESYVIVDLMEQKKADEQAFSSNEVDRQGLNLVEGLLSVSVPGSLAYILNRIASDYTASQGVQSSEELIPQSVPPQG